MSPAAPRTTGGARSSSARTAGEKPESARPGPPQYLTPGQRIAGRYEVLGVVGEGGMGVVYRCRDRTREVIAVKRAVLPESNPDEHLGWFVAEAQALAALSHDNIVRARDFGQLLDGTPYLAMDLVVGVSLQQLIADRLPMSLLWTLADQVLAALAHAHARGVVHGDLKPSNVLVENDGRLGPRARLFDFGLAKRCRAGLDVRLGQRSAPSHPPPSAGTPGYMAPEQILGRRGEICPGTDLYAFGCILYRALSGRPPFTIEHRHELDFHCFREPDPLVPLYPVPESLVEVVLGLLRKRPCDRPASAAEVRLRWREFEPKTHQIHDVRASSRSGTHRVEELTTGSETTRRISPKTPRPAATKLRRSNQWLPGLLSIRPSPLVGRTALSKLLAERFARVSAAEGGRRIGVVLTGAAGVGKSRLVDHLCTEVEEAGSAVVLRGFRPNAPGRDGLAVALSDAYGLEGGTLRRFPSALEKRCDRSDLGALVDWLLRSLDGRSNGGNRADESLPLAILRVLVEIAGARPLLVWVDDPAELGPETAALLAALPRHAPLLKLMVVTTARPEALAKPAAIAGVKALRAGLETEFVPVPPLDSLTTSAMLRAAHPVDSALALSIALDSGGVPLDALERLFALAKRGRIG